MLMNIKAQSMLSWTFLLRPHKHCFDNPYAVFTLSAESIQDRCTPLSYSIHNMSVFIGNKRTDRQRGNYLKISFQKVTRVDTFFWSRGLTETDRKMWITFMYSCERLFYIYIYIYIFVFHALFSCSLSGCQKWVYSDLRWRLVVSSSIQRSMVKLVVPLGIQIYMTTAYIQICKVTACYNCGYTTMYGDSVL